MASFAGIFQTIVLLGAVQGFLVSVLLFNAKRNRLPNRLLAAMLFLLALASLNIYASAENWFNTPWLSFIANFIPWVMIMPLGPLLYFYVQASLDTGFRITVPQRRHFVTVVIDLVPVLTTIIYVAGVLGGVIKNDPHPWGIFIDTYDIYSDIPRWASLTIYLWLSVKYLAALPVASREHPRYRPLQRFTRVFLCFQVIWLAYLIPYVIPRYTQLMLGTFDWYPVYVPLAILIYWLGINGFMMTFQEAAVVKKAEASTTALDNATIEPAIEALKKAMETDRLYLDTTLQLNSLSQHINISPKIISAVLNQHLNKNFNEYVNTYRVAAFKEKVLLPEMEPLTIAAIAYESGFSSLATFQRVFKQNTGMSPSEYRKQAMEAM